MAVGMLDDLLQAQALIARQLERADPERMKTVDAAALLKVFSAIRRLGAAGEVLCAPRAAQSTVWRDEGHRSPAAWMAKTTGCELSDALHTLEAGGALDALPATQEALRHGELSRSQLKVITDAAPTRACDERALLAAAATGTMKGLKEKGAQIKAAATSEKEEAERHRAIRASRYLRHWSAPDGAFRLDARLTPEAGAQVMACLSREADARFQEARKNEDHEPPAAYAADALVALVTGTAICARRRTPKTPRAIVVMRVDASAWKRGYVKPGETCVIPGVGPVPVAAVRRQLPDAFLKILVTRGADVTTVCHVGRTVPAHLQSALEARDPTCVVPGCDTALGLENHHWREPYAECKTATLSGLARVCAWHHELLTYDGYVLEGGPGRWAMRAPPGGGGFDTS
jgi:hypothetical protein